MKRVIILVILTLCISIPSNVAVAKDIINDSVFMMIGNQNALVYGNLQKLSMENEAIFPFVMDDRVLVPLRALSIIFDAQIEWDCESKTAIVKKEGNIAQITAGKKEIIINNKIMALDTPSTIIYDSFFLPLRIVAENILGKNVTYLNHDQMKARMIMISDQILTVNNLDSISLSAAEQLSNAIDSMKNGLSEDEKYYYINGRAYLVNGFAQKKEAHICKVDICPEYENQGKIPLLTLNWKLLNDPKIYKMVSDDFNLLMEEIIIEKPQISLYVRKEIAQETKVILKSIIDKGYPIKTAGAFRLSPQDYINEAQAKGSGKEEGAMWARFHPNGLAIDLNWDENPLVYKGSKEFEQEEKERDGITDLLHIKFHPNEHFVVNTFLEHGWVWGGRWNSLKDYMHFSMGEY